MGHIGSEKLITSSGQKKTLATIYRSFVLAQFSWKLVRMFKLMISKISWKFFHLGLLLDSLMDLKLGHIFYPNFITCQFVYYL